MTARTLRRRRVRRLAVTAALATALAVATTMSVLWRKSESARGEALAAVRNAEAQQLFALGQLELEKHPTAALAYALASLENTDTPHARLLALRALWRGAPAFALAATDKQGPGPQLGFSPDGRWLANVEQSTGTVRLWGEDGSGPRELLNPGARPSLGFTGDSRFVVITQPETARIYSLPEAKLVRQIDESFLWSVVGGQDLVTGHELEPAADGSWRFLVKTRRLPDGEPETLGVLTTKPNEGAFIDPIRRRAITERASVIYEQPLDGSATATPRRLFRNDEEVRAGYVAPDGERMFMWGASGAGRIWSLATGARVPGPQIDRPEDASWSIWSAKASGEGRWLAAGTGEEGVLLWDLRGPVAAGPRVLRRDAQMLSVAFDPSGSWMAARDNRALTLWPLAWRHPQVLRAPTKGLRALAIDPRGRWVAAAGHSSSKAWLWPLAPQAGAERLTLETGGPVAGLAVSPRGDRLAAGGSSGVRLVPLRSGPLERLRGFEGVVRGLDFDPEGRRLAAAGVGFPLTRERIVRIWDLETHASQVLDPGDAQPLQSVEFWPDGRLLSAGGGGVRLWDVAATRSTLVLEGVPVARRSPDGRQLLGIRARIGPGGAVGTALVYDLERKEAKPLETHGNQVTSVAWDLSGRLVVTGSRDGVVRVGPVTGEEPHLLFGHEAGVPDVEVSPGGEWIASASEDGTVRLWPLPLEERPFHTLPHGELLGRLRSFTNFRVVRDPAMAGGYRLDFEPFTGWKRKPPSW